MLRSSRNLALWLVPLLSCSTSSPSGDGDAATGVDTGAETSGTAGGSGAGGASGGSGGGAGVGGASGSSGSGGAAGASAGSGGATAGRGGSAGGGGAAGSSGGGQAGTAGGDRDAARDAAPDTADASSDPSLGADRNVDASTDAGADMSDARADTSAPPSDGAACTPLPSAGVYATFRVVSDVFHAPITNANGIDQAIALWRGQSKANIPTGQLECANGTYNCGWTWRMNPASITFAEITIEVCDATPSYVQNNCASFPNGQYCPWSAELIALRDCRTDSSCPAVSR